MARLSQAELLAGLRQIVGDARLSIRQTDRITYSADFWPKTQIWKQAGEVGRYRPDCIVWPEDEDEVRAVLRFCHDNLVPVVAYGGGSGVCGGTMPIHGGVIVDTKRMRRLLQVDERSQTVAVEVGINGQHLEDLLNARGLTLGHFPSSIMCSTLGGWLATRSAGQFSSRYGKIEDMVLSLRVALPTGELLDTERRAPGEPDWNQLFVGSEGTLGIITSAVLKVHPLAEARRFRAFRFRHLGDGLRGARAVMQAGLKPVVLRLYDPFDSLIAMGKDHEADRLMTGPLGVLRGVFAGVVSGRSQVEPGGERQGHFVARRLATLRRELKRKALIAGLSAPALTNRLADSVPSPCLLIIGFEGPADAIHADLWSASELLREAGGKDAGAKLGEAWLERRYAISFKQSTLFGLGAFADTMEVATTWDRLEGLYAAVRKALAPHVFVMAHFSHAYREGCSIYFTFAGYRRDPERAERHYDRVWRLGMEAVLAAGGTVSHHHGIGVSKMGSMVREHGEMLGVWQAIKRTIDPHGVMNPGKLFPEAAGVVDGGGAAAAQGEGIR